MSLRSLLMRAKSSAPQLGVAWTYQDDLSRSQTVYGGGSVNALLHADSLFLAAGSEGRLATSYDGAFWSYKPGLKAAWEEGLAAKSLAWSGSVYVAVGDAGAIAYSYDTNTWTRVYADGAPSSFNKVIYTGSLFVAVGQFGKLYTSSSGTTWTQCTMPMEWGSSDIKSIASNGSLLVIAGEGGKIATSPDGVFWTYRAGLTSTTFGTNTAYDLVWNDTKFIVVGDFDHCASSTDGVTWTYRTSMSGGSWRRLLYANATVFAFAADGSVAQSTDDGDTWSTSTTLALEAGWDSAEPAAVAYGSGTYLVAGNTLSADGVVATASFPDGGWSIQTDLKKTDTIWGDRATVLDIVWNGSQFLAVGEDGHVATSPDGVFWTHQPGLRASAWAGGTVHKVVWASYTYVVVGSDGGCATSPDGVSWTYQSALQGQVGSRDMLSLVWTGVNLIAAGSEGYVAKSMSAGGSLWLSRDHLRLTSGWGAADVLGLVWNNGSTLLAYGPEARVATSTDEGESWTYRNSNLVAAGWGGSVGISKGIWDGSQFVIMADGESGVATSPDGITWTTHPYTAPPISYCTMMAAANGQVFAAGFGGAFYTSKNSIDWIDHSFDLASATGWENNNVHAMAFSPNLGNPDLGVAGGTNGKIATTTPQTA